MQLGTVLPFAAVAACLLALASSALAGRRTPAPGDDRATDALMLAAADGRVVEVIFPAAGDAAAAFLGRCRDRADALAREHGPLSRTWVSPAGARDADLAA